MRWNLRDRSYIEVSEQEQAAILAGRELALSEIGYRQALVEESDHRVIGWGVVVLTMITIYVFSDLIENQLPHVIAAGIALSAIAAIILVYRYVIRRRPFLQTDASAPKHPNPMTSEAKLLDAEISTLRLMQAPFAAITLADQIRDVAAALEDNPVSPATDAEIRNLVFVQTAPLFESYREARRLATGPVLEEIDGRLVSGLTRLRDAAAQLRDSEAERGADRVEVAQRFIEYKNPRSDLS